MKESIDSIELYLRRGNYLFTPHDSYIEVLHQNSGKNIYILDILGCYEIQYSNKSFAVMDEAEVVSTLNRLMTQKDI